MKEGEKHTFHHLLHFLLFTSCPKCPDAAWTPQKAHPFSPFFPTAPTGAEVSDHLCNQTPHFLTLDPLFQIGEGVPALPRPFYSVKTSCYGDPFQAPFSPSGLCNPSYWRPSLSIFMPFCSFTRRLACSGGFSLSEKHDIRKNVEQRILTDHKNV